MCFLSCFLIYCRRAVSTQRFNLWWSVTNRLKTHPWSHDQKCLRKLRKSIDSFLTPRLTALLFRAAPSRRLETRPAVGGYAGRRPPHLGTLVATSPTTLSPRLPVTSLRRGCSGLSVAGLGHVINARTPLRLTLSKSAP